MTNNRTNGIEFKPADSIGFRKENYPEVLKVVNELAEVAERKPQNATQLLILKYGPIETKRLRDFRDSTNSSVQTDNTTKNNTKSQEKTA